ncbi:MAG: hypothetical protein ACKVVP_16675 [Chloroflexota bacterium]
MDELRARRLRNELTEFASRWWAGEAEVTRTFFSQPRRKDEHLRWLRMQAFKELQPRPNGIIIRLISELKDEYDRLEHGVERHDFLHKIQFLEEEFRHYQLFADVVDHLTGQQITPSELSTYEVPEEAKLRELRTSLMKEHGELARFASSFCEGGGASLYYEGMQVGGDPLHDMIATACRGVYEDEIEHAEQGASGLERGEWSDEQWALAKSMVEAISKQRVRMRNDQFGHVLSAQRLTEIDEGKIDLPERYKALLV